MPQTSDTITRRISEHLGEHRYAMWFGETDITVDGSDVRIRARSQFVADWINHRFNRTLRSVVQDELGATADIHVTVDTKTPPASRRHEQPQEGDRGRRPSPPGTSGSRHSGLANLDEFIVGDCNRLAWSAACRLADEGDRSTVSPLFIHGGCGLGKTHLLQGICRRAAARFGDRARIRYVTGEQFTNEYITAIQKGSMDTFRQAHRGLRLLAIDDVHFLSNKKKTQSEFPHTLDAIGLTGARLALASDEHPHDIARFSKGLVSRFLGGRLVSLTRWR